ncbi:hypothetical protein [Streptomyces griseoruber]|uniref:aromatic-ring hydroxylase C-terminal domain-containing protein n=1 Tax=Streptomyces griseoruber TaxID=1943 RepID=UPI000AAB57AC
MRRRAGPGGSGTWPGRRGTTWDWAPVLVRPDGIVAREGEGDVDRDAFERAAGHWFGGPAE